MLYCDGGKPKKMVERKPFEALVRGAGVTGLWPWFPEYVHDLIDKPYILRVFTRPIVYAGSTVPGEWNSGGAMAATSWKMDVCAPPELITRSFVDITETSPNPVGARLRSITHLTAYGSRHLLPSVARAANGTPHELPLAMINELGNWDPSTILGIVKAFELVSSRKRPARSAAAAMPLRYAPNLFKSLQARDKVVKIVYDFIFARGLEAIPLQTGEVPTFEFLFQ